MSTYTIYSFQVEEVRKRLDRLVKKAARYGTPFSYSIGEEHPQDIAIRAVDPITQTIETVDVRTVSAVDVTVECDGLICANGWTIRARVEHGDKANIVTGIGKQPVRPEWYTAPARCDHCKVNRARAVTYFCEQESGEIRQVGRTCLKDYTGISPDTAAIWAEVQDILAEDMDCTDSEWHEHEACRMFSVERVLAHACDDIKEFGYRKSEQPSSTRDAVACKVAGGNDPSDEGQERAKVLLHWLKDLDAVVRDEDAAYEAAWKKFDETNDSEAKRELMRLERKRTGSLERSCIPLALSGYCKSRHIGLLAYIPIAYERHLERKAKEEAREAARIAAAKASNYVGVVGERITIVAESARLVTSWDTEFGVTRLYKFLDGSGNVFIWKSSKRIEIADGMVITGTVKAHSEYDGIKQTVITRVRPATAKSAKKKEEKI